jgi:hypothetical protein
MTAAYHRNLRLGLSGFSAEDAEQIAAIVRSLWTPQAPWVVSSETPVDALLLARGTRPDDPPHSAVLRVNLSRKPLNPRDAERRLAPLMLRKPIRSAAMRVALEAAIARMRRFRRLPRSDD